ncbi:hypothetical protein HS041_28140 [Planomonospora sp. ID67723]|uniref:hypothetical protein n=1 Tax=Planomonospora sp. ID67723 TaxID=2738134 RepID=UPI0018C41FB8|nr:hypothetical protein [Planomonospora sp. ID67723]MBG0831606.1 hypothetical protein [Planomonospora sp. ID67723]
MRVTRFEPYLIELIRSDGAAIVKSAESFAAAALSEKPHGVRLELATGAQVGAAAGGHRSGRRSRQRRR